MALNDSLRSVNPDFSDALKRFTSIFNESFVKALSETFADRFLTAICDGLKTLSVSFSDNTSKFIFPRLISSEFTLKSINSFFSFFSFGARRSAMNFILILASRFFLVRFMSEPNSCMLLILIFPLIRAWISNLAENLAIFIILAPVWSYTSKSFIIIRFSSPKSILPILTSVFNSLESSRVASELIPCCTFGIFSRAISPK